jgi:hypothetical protein
MNDSEFDLFADSPPLKYVLDDFEDMNTLAWKEDPLVMLDDIIPKSKYDHLHHVVLSNIE